jgi:hypothetical protein
MQAWQPSGTSGDVTTFRAISVTEVLDMVDALGVSGDCLPKTLLDAFLAKKQFQTLVR